MGMLFRFYFGRLAWNSVAISSQLQAMHAEDLVISTSRKIAGMSLNQGVTPINAVGLLLGVCCMAFCFIGLNMVQPWLLEHHLNLPTSQIGDATGTLGAIGQIITVLLAGAMGALADQKGRRLVLTLGVVVMAVGILIAPLVSTLSGLIVSRTVFSIGRTAVAACFLIVVADYVQKNSRGKWNAIQGVTFGIGSILAATVIVRLPKWLLERGWDVIDAGYATHFVMVGAAGLSALVLWLMLRADGPREGVEHQNLWALIREGVAEIRQPGVRLAYCAGFASGANMAVIGTYLTLWTAGHAVATGVGFAQGLALGGVLMVIIQLVALAAMPAIGVLNDRAKPLLALQVSLVLAVVGYGSTYLVADPSALSGNLSVALLSVGQSAVIISSQVFVQAEAPVKIRGTIIGFFTVCSGLGAAVILKLSGYVFDSWLLTGPFVLTSAVNAVVLVFALLLGPAIGRERARIASR
ncbi:MAG: MFS transporter [Gammaproteobacteria bacterium]|nr:MFS transporter [Gammaproteobacteria bacterium]